MSQQLQINPLQWTITFSWNPKIRWAFALCLCLTYSVSAQQTGGGERKPGNERWDDVERTSTKHFRLHSDCRIVQAQDRRREGAMTVTCAGTMYVLHCYGLVYSGALETAVLEALYKVLYSCTIVLSTFELFIYCPRKPKEQCYFNELNWITMRTKSRT